MYWDSWVAAIWAREAKAMGLLEKAIHDALQAVEKMGADVKLTKAGIKLQEAQRLVADFVDGKEV